MTLIFRKYFRFSILFTVFSLAFLFALELLLGESIPAALQALFIAFVLSILEISLSFDNAIVNAIVLEKMTPIWQRRFLTWGMLIAVFGMRLIFPLVIVAIVGKMSPWAALVLSVESPQSYAQMMKEAHIDVAAFGGAFLLMVALKFFYDEHKEVYWLRWLERPFTTLGKIEAIEVGLVLATLLVFVPFLPKMEQVRFLSAGIMGLLVFIVIDGVGGFLQASEKAMKDAYKAQFSLFLYLEVLDASFSFDGVIGAFAITQNLFTIMVGLSIGAFFVRSLTLYFVGEKTLKQFVYLEHGAFYAIGFLALFMLLGVFIHIPEWVTGLTGGFVILSSFWSSLRSVPTTAASHRPQE